jgi:DNA-binding MarR family transcriptional regulator
MYTSDKESIILEHIYYNDSLKQRELAAKAGISLGMTNAVLKRLIEKGWLEVKRLNNRNISYVVSPAGIEELFKRSYSYFKRTVGDVRLYKEGIERLVSNAAKAGYSMIVLVGNSDLDFIVDFVCWKANVEFNQVDNITSNKKNKNEYLIYSEQIETVKKDNENRWLRTIIMRQK